MTKTPRKRAAGEAIRPVSGDRPTAPALTLAVGGPPALRADAARNRAKVLTAAAALFRDKGVDRVSVDEIVAAAGVGKGTLFRIFGDKSGLAAALLDERERELQQRILFGPPPLGPGAGAADRIGAFVREYVRYVAEHVDLVRMSQTARPGARFDTGAHQFWRTHLAYLAGEAGQPDPRLVADVLLAARHRRAGRSVDPSGRADAGRARRNARRPGHAALRRLRARTRAPRS